MGFVPPQLDVALRAYVPAFETIGRELPEPTITVTNIAAARDATGLSWEPAAEAQYRVRALGPGRESVEAVAGMKYVTRGLAGPVLGSTKSSYHVFGNDEVFAIAETIGVAALEAGRTCRFIAGGQTDGGRKVFLLAELGVRQVYGDPSPHVRYMTLLSSHGGSGALKVLGTDMRWTCTNALRAAELEAAATASAFSFRHTSRMAKRLADSQKAIEAAVLQAEQVEAITTRLLRRRVTQAQVSDYLAQYALARVVSKGDPLRRAQADASPQRQYAIDSLEGELRTIYASPTCDGIRDTAYGPLAAVVEYLDNRREARSEETRFERSMVAVEPGKLLGFRMLRDLF
jgi:phage/plasmid-like protein (TIGR03299 family)